MKANKLAGGERTSLVDMFWRFYVVQGQMTESQRLKSIHAGFIPGLYQAVRYTFLLQDRQIEVLLNTSISALERRRRDGKKLNLVASERLDRIAFVCHLAADVFEDKQAAIDWLSRSNEILGDQPPIMLCDRDWRKADPKGIARHGMGRCCVKSGDFLEKNRAVSMTKCNT